MTEVTDILKNLKQHDKLAIRISSNSSGHLPDDIYQKFLKPHRKPHYFFLLVVQGKSIHTVDLKKITVAGGQLLFVLPHQIHILPPKKDNIEYFKLGFDENCLSLLPKPFPFLINPLNSQLLTFSEEEKQRVRCVFGMLHQLLETRHGDTALILANLNTLLTEFNQAYFKNNKAGGVSRNGLSKFIAFKMMVETRLTEQPSIQSIAEKLGMTTNGLYHIVRSYSGVSPKEFMINRLMLEAQRKLFYSETSVKELAFELGFNDPDYFSKLFKKNTGKSISQFVEMFQDLSGN